MCPNSARGVRDEQLLRLRGVVDQVPARLSYWDSEQRCRFANRAYQRWFGVSPDALFGMHLREVLGPLYELARPHIEAVLRGEPQEFEREVPDPMGGPPRYNLANYVPDIVNDVVCGFYVLVTDVTELKRTNLALEASEAKFSGIISIAADAIISVGTDQRITIFNKGAEKIFGYAKEEVIGRDLGLLLPARIRDSHRQHVAAFAAGAETSRQMTERGLKIFGVRKNGEEFPADAAISKLTVGAMTLLTVSLRDITERTRIEMEQQVVAEAGAVLASSLDYRQTLETIAELVVRHAAQMCIVYMIEEDATVRRLTVAHADPTKAAACKTLAKLSVEPRHILSAAVIETRHPQLFDDISPELLESYADDEEHLRVLREIAPRSALMVPLLSGGGVLGALVLASSRPHQFGARDIGLAAELARRAALAIENARLYEAAKRATQARDEILGIVAHDVRSPLNVIFLTAQLLERRLEKIADAKCREHVKSIMRSVTRAECLIRDLLDVSRTEAGALTLACEVVATKPVIVDVWESLGCLASEASIELRLEADEALPAIWADQDRLRQVFENLVGNAIKFTPKGGCITVTATCGLGAVQFSVADTGIGIPEHNLPHVFDRFWQAESASRDGAGLGLPICKGIIEAHGGQIWVESTLGRGASFFFTIPTVVGKQALPPESSAQSGRA
jgi:PAS domain S-box-containing protein